MSQHQLMRAPSTLALEMLEDELSDVLRCDFTQVDDTTVWIDFPSGYRIVAMCEILKSSSREPKQHRVKREVFDRLFADEGADALYFVVGQGDTGPQATDLKNVLGEVHIDVSPDEEEEFFYDLEVSGFRKDPYERLLSAIIRAAAFRTINAWQPLNFQTIRRGTGVSPGKPVSLLNKHLSHRGSGYGKWKGVWRVIGRDEGARRGNYRRLEMLSDGARAATKARAKVYAEKHPPARLPETVEEQDRSWVQSFAHLPAPLTHKTVEERLDELGLRLPKKRLAWVKQEAARLYRDRFGCDPRRKLDEDDESDPGEFAYAKGDGFGILGRVIREAGGE